MHRTCSASGCVRPRSSMRRSLRNSATIKGVSGASSCAKRVGKGRGGALEAQQPCGGCYMRGVSGASSCAQGVGKGRGVEERSNHEGLVGGQQLCFTKMRERLLIDQHNTPWRYPG